MKKIVKIILFLIIFLLLIGNIAYSAMILSDINNSKYKKEILFVTEKKIMMAQGDKFRPTATVTREELAKTIYDMMQYEEKIEKEARMNETETLNLVAKVLPSTAFISANGAIGSGILVKENYVLTAFHVVAGAQAKNLPCEVKFYNNETTYKCKVSAVDVKNDLAMLKSDKPIKMPIVVPASKISLGQTALAFGNPYGLKYTITKGIISGKGIDFGNVTGTYTQFDTPINFGNSGGALVNLNGELIGIVSKKYPNAEGLGFAVDLDIVRAFIKNYTN